MRRGRALSLSESELVEIRADGDIVRARQAARRWAVDLGFGLSAATRIVTATSELARNTLGHGGGGTMLVERIDEDGRSGLRLTFIDEGPGISDIEQALVDGFTTGVGLGLGLPGARRLVDGFSIESRPGAGTRVQIVGWL